MPKPKQHPSATTIVSPSLLNKAGDSLQKLPAKTKEVWSLREVVVLLEDDISGALQRGYSYDEIVAILRSKKISITAASLKRYLAMARRESGKSKPRKRRKSSKAIVEAAEVQPTKSGKADQPIAKQTTKGKAASAKTKAMPAPTVKRRGRGAATK